MQFEGKFLGAVEDTFETEEGKTLKYFVLHAWSDKTVKYFRIKVKEPEYKKIVEANMNFGDDFTCEVEPGVDQKGKAFLRVVKW